MILLSGPEPQRTELSAMLWQQVQNFEGKVIFIEGSENAITPSSVPKHITYHKRLTNAALLPLLQSAGMVVCRSGYSTIMDLTILNKKTILIPTPGQTEQEYLGKHLHKEGLFYCAKQDGFDINDALKKAAAFAYRSALLGAAYSSYKTVVDEWLMAL